VGVHCRWPRRPRSVASGLLRVADEAGGLIGFGHGSEVLSDGLAVIPAGERYLDVDALYVRADRRRAGLGGLILDELRALARADGIERAFVFTAAKDQHAIMRFYERHGLRPWGMQFFI